MRSPFQRDRDRILHSTSFRRLIHKTQVFIFHEGDHYRTRLTHSLEVAQIARTICRQLRLDEDLAEALALAHDLGHPPFGHAGERALDRAMHDFGGFDHNAQSLRAVMHLERKYMRFDGLNLSWETLEGLAKHNGPIAGGADHPILRYSGRLMVGSASSLSAGLLPRRRPQPLPTISPTSATISMTGCGRGFSPLPTSRLRPLPGRLRRWRNVRRGMLGREDG